jgi:hypothetical protein
VWKEALKRVALRKEGRDGRRQEKNKKGRKEGKSGLRRGN